MKLTRRTFLTIAGTAAAAGCADEDEVIIPTADGGPDPVYDAMPFDGDDDASPDDAGDDVDDASAADAGDDAAPDGGVDAGFDGGSDGAVDGGFDGGVDAARDGALDAASDVPRDLGVDAARDVGVDVPRDTGADAARDAAVDVLRDTGVDAGIANPDFRTLPERTASFPLSVMAGDATDTSVIFWTKFEGTGALTLRVLEMNGTRIAAVRFNGVVTPSSAGFVRAVVTGLRAGREHRYAFLTGPTASPTGRSPVGRVKTAPAEDALVTMTFAGTSCSNQNFRPHPPLVHAGSRTDLDFFIHAGDHTYTDHGADAMTLAQYRAEYEENWGAAGLRALHRSTGMYLTWDDHEVANNWNPETFPAARLAAARTAFFEFRATRRNTTDPNRIWRSFRWGRTAEMFILDCRSERRPSTRSGDPARTSYYLSRAQMDWLKPGLRASPCVFKFIVNSVPIVDRGGAGSDNWNGYASQRREILNHIVNNNLRGVVWLSGDVHFGGVCRVEPAGTWSNQWEVIMGPAGADRDSPPDVRAAQFPVLVSGVHNYTVMRANPTTRTLSVEFINGSGNRIANSAWSRTF